jgi:peptidyl-dipeptidase A
MKRILIPIAAAAVSVVLRAAGPPTVREAQQFIEDAEVRLLALSVDGSRADWVKSTYITDDTEALAAKADERLINLTVDLAKKSTRFDSLKLPEDVARKMKLLKLSLTLATPADAKESEELTRIAASMEGTYGKGKYCPPGKSECLDLEDLTRVMANSRNPAELLDAWRGWHAIARPIRPEFVRYVALANKGARELGFADSGAMWRAKYDMPPDDFAKELDRLWEQVRPLYLSLHAYIRTKLREQYGADAVPADGPIPAQLLGNMWAQTWDYVYPLAAPKDADPGFDLTEILKSRKTDYKQMVHYGEHFFTSLGFAPLP